MEKKSHSAGEKNACKIKNNFFAKDNKTVLDTTRA
jgi:hypothetical protein